MMKTLKTVLFLTLILAFIRNTQQLERKDYLKCGQKLLQGQFIQSTNGYYAILQSDCNFVVYRTQHFVSRNVLWSSGTARKNCKRPILVNQNNGDVVIYNNGVIRSSNVIWRSKTAEFRYKCYDLIMQDDGNLVLYNDKSVALWNTETSA